MDRLRTAPARSINDGVDGQVGVAGRRRADAFGPVSKADMQRARIGVGVDRDRADAQLTTGSDHADGDLAAVRDEQAPERWRRRVRAQRRGSAQSGMLPCFLGGSDWRLFSSIASAPATRARDSNGWMTSSTYPRAAAMYG